MEKKSFAFVLLLTVSFFFLNQYVFNRDDEAIAARNQSIQERYEGRVLEAKELPLIALYKDKKGSEFLANALSFDGLLIALDGDDVLPATAYDGKSHAYDLKKAGNVGIYRSSNSGKLPSVALPKGEVELQLVTTSGEDVGTMIGELEANYLHFPYKTIENDALALYQFGDALIPVGYWSYETKQFSRFEDMSEMKGILAVRKPIKSAGRSSSKEEFYVLENDYQQVVFSNYGGAIAEINLPFHSKDNHNSVVLPISFDHKIEDNYPENAKFPLFPYSSPIEKGIQQPTQGGYTPLLRRDLVSKSGQVTFDMPAQSYAMTLVSDSVDGDTALYRVVDFKDNEITFASNEPSRRVKKTFRFVEDAPYTLEVTVSIEGDTKGLWFTSGIPEVELVSGSYLPLLQYYTDTGKKKKIEKIKLPKGTANYPALQSDWTSNSNGFFGVIMDPSGGLISGMMARQLDGDSVPTRLSLIDPEYGAYPPKDYPGYEILMPYQKGPHPMTFRVYAGPYEDDVMKVVDRVLTDPTTGWNPSFTMAITYQGWLSFIAEPFSKFLYIVMNFFHMITNSWGLSIILLTLVLRILLYPLNAWAFKSNAKLSKVGPKLKEIQEKYKKDPKRLQMETAMVYKNEGINPFSSCLPLFIQFPFLMGMFDLLKTTFELRGASFIPGWIDNLTAPDVLFSWKYPLIFFGTSFHLLPFILAALMYIQTKVNTKMQLAKGPMTDQQKQMANMGNILTFVFLFAFYNMPSGLNIYWIFSTLFGMIQQWLITSRLVDAGKKPKRAVKE